MFADKLVIGSSNASFHHSRGSRGANAVCTVRQQVVAHEESAQFPVNGESPPEERDSCKAHREALEIIAELQPKPNAHLLSKASITPFAGHSWGEGLGMSSTGPISTSLRILPKLVNSLLHPFARLSQNPIVSKIWPVVGKGTQSRDRTRKVELLGQLLDQAIREGCLEAYGTKGMLNLIPPQGVQQDLYAAYSAFKASTVQSSNSSSQFMTGFFHASALGGVERDQAKALLYYTFAALQGEPAAEMALGYRNWAGIGIAESCQDALDYYQTAAEKAYAYFLTGPPGGRTLPLVPSRLSDRAGGAYGPHASWASTGGNAGRAAVRASSAMARGETESEVLEFYQYHSDRDDYKYTVRLGRLFYLGSVYALPGGIASGAESVGAIPQSFDKARAYFLKVARTLWPVDYDHHGQVAPKRKLAKDSEDVLREPAMTAAAFLGRMSLRGEGVKMDFKRARMWYERAVEFGDKEAQNGLGIIYRDGLGVAKDRQKAFQYFQAAASQDLAEAQVNLGKMNLELGDAATAAGFFNVAINHGSQFEAFHLLASTFVGEARTPKAQGGRPGMCGAAVAWYKLVAERGCWKRDIVGEADRAWARGEHEAAVTGWMLAGEMGYEVAQNNVAFVFDQSTTFFGDKSPLTKLINDSATTALIHWTRSAAQDNVDSMVKVGDYYYNEVGLLPGEDRFDKAAGFYQSAADTLSSAMAYWNLGWMYENGLGVPQDWHLAKRFYDLSLETNSEAYLPVMLSLLKLYVRSWWIEIATAGEKPGLSLFEDIDSEHPRSLFERVKLLFASKPRFQAVGEAGTEGADREQAGVEGYDADEAAAWRREREEDEYEDHSESGWAARRAAGEVGDDDDTLETAIILTVVVIIMGLVYVRGRWVRQQEEPRGQPWGRPLDVN